jgi:hypothetical protein
VKSSSGEVARAVVAISAVFWAQHAWVGWTNFWGFDEWVHLDLLGRGVLSFPHAARPLALLWSLPVRLLGADDLRTYHVLQAAYLSGTGVLTYLLCRRLLPAEGTFALLAGVFAAVWAPRDSFRLMSVGLMAYAGSSFGALLSVLLLVESWSGRRSVLLAAAAAVCLLTASTFEGVLPLLAAAVLLLPLLRRGPGLLRWSLAWLAAVAVATLLALAGQLSAPPGASYQAALRLDAHPVRYAGRLLDQYGFHLGPAVLLPFRPQELLEPAAAVSGALFVAVLAAWWRFQPVPGTRPARPLAVALAVGLAAAGAAYSAMVLSPNVNVPVRTQFLSSSGIGVALAAAVSLLARATPARFCLAALALLGGWIAGVSGARTLAMQRGWASFNRHPLQNDSLARIVALAPDLAPHTLVVLLDDAGGWPAAFSFHHAVRHLYGDHVTATVWGASQVLYPARFGADGVSIEPWPVLRQAWQAPPTRHDYSEVVLFRHAAPGRIELLEDWPPGLTPLPVPTRYEPQRRVRREPPAAGRHRRVLLPPLAPEG